jgi:hypothetical protein
VSLNIKKHQRSAQFVEYAGLLFDTFRGRRLVTLATQISLLETVEALCAGDASWTLRSLDSVKGLLLHYSVAIGHLRILVTKLGRLMPMALCRRNSTTQ